jgi:hypothetical protein
MGERVMRPPVSDVPPKMPTHDGLYIEIKTSSVCDRRKVDPWTYAENWSTDVWVVGFAIDHDEVKLWHPGDPVPEELIQAIASGSPIICRTPRVMKA